MTHLLDKQFLQQCIELAIASVATGGGPFGAVIVRQGKVLARADNRSTESHDPTAHAEVNVIRRAAVLRGSPHLADCVLYASCEPCPMCLAAAMWAHIPRIVFTASQAEAVRAGFDDGVIAARLYGQATPARLPADFLEHCVMPDAAAPFDAWLANTDRIEY